VRLVEKIAKSLEHLINVDGHDDEWLSPLGSEQSSKGASLEYCECLALLVVGREDFNGKEREILVNHANTIHRRISKTVDIIGLHYELKKPLFPAIASGQTT